MSSKETHVASYRLSRLQTLKNPEPLKDGFYAEAWYRDHPIVQEDVLPAKEKLQTLSKSEEVNIDSLIQERFLNLILYGEKSKQLLKSTIDLADYYSKTDCYDSALRHFINAKALEEENPTHISTEDKQLIAIGMGECYFIKRAENKNNMVRCIRYFNQYQTKDLKSPELKFRHTLLGARIKTVTENDQAAYPKYLECVDGIPTYLEDEILQGRVYTEIGDISVRVLKFEEAKEYYQKAIDVYEKSEQDFSSEIRVLKDLIQVSEEKRIRYENGEPLQPGEEDDEHVSQAEDNGLGADDGFISSGEEAPDGTPVEKGFGADDALSSSQGAATADDPQGSGLGIPAVVREPGTAFTS